MIQYQILSSGGVLMYDDEVPDDQGTAFGPADGQLWGDYHARMAAPGFAFKPRPAPPAPPPAPYNGFDFAAAGAARRQRQVTRLAAKDPVAAALLQGGIKT